MDNNNQTNYAGFWIRWFAQFLDILIWSVNFFVPLYLLSAFSTSGIETFLPGFLWFLLYVLFVAGFIRLFVHPFLISRMGAGLGKLACGLEIVKEGNNRLTYKNSIFREYIAKIASNALLGLGYYWIFKTPQKQGWHDSLAGTYVVKKHQGLLTGLMVFILFAAINGGLTYQSFNNFKNATTLQFDIMTIITQIQQDFSKKMESEEVPVVTDINSNIDTSLDYENMTMDELLREVEKYNTQ